jgi:NAD(P)-dependent dehydrogenase (short-subunit alcohol dehydrogenase family)
MGRFDSQTAVITGGASGIGLALGAAMARDGAKVLLADVEPERAETAAAKLRAEGLQVTAKGCDVTAPAQVEALADAAFATLGRVDFLFNNAGVGIGGPLEKVKAGAIQWVFAVNVMGVYHGVHAFAPRMLAQGGACRIVNTASEHAVGLPNRGGQVTAYTASKHAVLGLSDAMRRDYEGTNLAVSVLCPAVVQSDIWNTLRNRPDYAGGPRQIDPKYAAENQQGLPANIAAARVLDQLAAGEFFLFTHGRDLQDVSAARGAEIAAALERFAERFGPDA